MFNTSSSFDIFMIEGKLCPKCKKGHLYFQGKRALDVEAKGDTLDADMTGYVCDNCGFIQKAVGRRLYEDVPVGGGRVTANVTKGKTKAKKKTKKKTK
jgi:hypothetical protein